MRKVCFDNYKLDPCHFVRAPDVFWYAILSCKYREDPKFKIELMTDSDMYLMIEKGMKGGLSQISHRYAKTSIDTKVEEDRQVQEIGRLKQIMRIKKTVRLTKIMRLKKIGMTKKIMMLLNRTENYHR